MIAAGGIADGRGLAAAMALRASGAWIGKRFLASPEAAIHSRYRDLLLAAKETDTEYGTLFDVHWLDAPHRTLRNAPPAAVDTGSRRPRGLSRSQTSNIIVGRFGVSLSIVQRVLELSRAA